MNMENFRSTESVEGFKNKEKSVLGEYVTRYGLRAMGGVLALMAGGCSAEQLHDARAELDRMNHNARVDNAPVYKGYEHRINAEGAIGTHGARVEVRETETHYGLNHPDRHHKENHRDRGHNRPSDDPSRRQNPDRRSNEK
ncbi:hypothetical protein KW782_00130 [Candidatus Parcubacteria bacterium]|nr:hypothetical protein [Candidatus Parcubacteria bacterium]